MNCRLLQLVPDSGKLVWQLRTDSPRQESTTTGTIQTSYSRHWNYKRTEQNDPTLLTDRYRLIAADRHHFSLTANNINGKTDKSVYTNRTKNIRLTTAILLTPMMTSAQVVETPDTTTDNNPSQDYTHPDDQTTLIQCLFFSPLNWNTDFTFTLIFDQ